MGQAKLKQLRLLKLSQYCAGPGAFPDHDASVVFLCRNNLEAKVRFIEALAEVVSQESALAKSIEKLLADAQPEVAWFLVTHSPGGGDYFQQLTSIDGALMHSLERVGEGYAARKGKWTTLVFGAESDVDSVRPLVHRFIEDIKQARDVEPSPMMVIRDGPESKLVITVPAEDVVAMNLAPILLIFDTFTANPEMVDRVAGNIIISFSGYDVDERFVGQIPVVDAFLRQLLFFAPWAPLMCDPSVFLIWVKVLDKRAEITNNYDKSITIVANSEVSADILKVLSFTLVEFMIVRLFQKGLHPKMETAMQNWISFVRSGPGPVRAPDFPFK